MVVVAAPDIAHFARPVNWVDSLPHEGEFTYRDDKLVVKNIFEQAVSHQLTWLESEGHKDFYRYFLARREIMGGIRPLKRTMREFLEDFGFGSLKKSRKAGFGPVVCAALAGDAELVKSLLEAQCPMETPLKAMPQVGIVGGLTSLHLTIMQGWRNPSVLELLLQARANPNLPASGVPPLACCRTARDVQLLVDHRADVNGMYWPLKVPVLALASGESTKVEVIAKLLECRASANAPRHGGGLGMNQALSFVSVTANSNPNVPKRATQKLCPSFCSSCFSNLGQ